MSKPFEVGAYVHQRLNLAANGKASRTKCQGFKPDLGNSAVRHYRGAFENVAMVEMRTQLAIERAGLVTLHLQPARRSSIPTIDAWMKPEPFCGMGQLVTPRTGGLKVA